MPKRAPSPELAQLFAALGEPTRLGVVNQLCDGSEQSIATIATGVPITRQALTKHLKVLEAAGIARSRRVGRESVYRIDPAALISAERWIADVSAQWDGAIDRFKQQVER